MTRRKLKRLTIIYEALREKFKENSASLGELTVQSFVSQVARHNYAAENTMKHFRDALLKSQTKRIELIEVYTWLKLDRHAKGGEFRVGRGCPGVSKLPRSVVETDRKILTIRARNVRKRHWVRRAQKRNRRRNGIVQRRGSRNIALRRVLTACFRGPPCGLRTDGPATTQVVTIMLRPWVASVWGWLAMGCVGALAATSGRSSGPVPRRRQQPLVPHLGFMTFFSTRPELMQGWVTHGVDFYCDDDNLPVCDKSDTAFGSEINLTLAAWSRYGIPSLYPSLASIDGLMIRGVGLRSGWEQVLQSVMEAEILPNFGPDKALRGVFLGDEVCCGASAARCWAEGYAPLTAKVRQYLGPSAIIYANECLDITNPALNVTEVPPEFDLISVDHYEGYMPGTNGTAEVKAAKANYEVLFSKMHPWQRAVLLPGTFGCSNLSWADSAGLPLRLQQVQVLDKLHAYWAWAQNDTRIGGFCPWHFSTRFGNPQYPGDCDMELGAIEMPQVVAELRNIGEIIVQNAASGTSAFANGGSGAGMST